MSMSVDIPSLARPEFFGGQRLTAADLTEAQRYQRELRWLHNRGLHSWGIAFGLSVAGDAGSSTVTVQPGYALDCQGRELIVADMFSTLVPAVSGAPDGRPARFYLVASYMDDADPNLPASETRTGVCGSAGAVRRPEVPDIHWQDATNTGPGSGFRSGLDVVLATVQVRNCRLAATVSQDGRRDARPRQQPYVAAGSTSEGSTVWEFWPGPSSATALGVQTTVDTSLAGFGSTPSYMAHVVGDRQASFSLQGASGVMQMVEGLPSLTSATATAFVLRMLLPRDLQMENGSMNASGLFDPKVSPTLPARLETVLKWHVTWMGIES